jgi:hypothetical protein
VRLQPVCPRLVVPALEPPPKAARSDRTVMGEQTSGKLSKTFGWLGTAVMTIAALALVWVTVRGDG